MDNGLLHELRKRDTGARDPRAGAAGHIVRRRGTAEVEGQRRSGTRPPHSFAAAARMPDRSPAGRPLVIYGAGGHGHVVAEAARAAGYPVLGCLDRRAVAPDRTPAPQLDPADPRLAEAVFLVAVGNNAVRRSIAGDLCDQGHSLATVIHPTAFVSATASIGQGVFIGPKAIVNARARIGDGCIINSGAIVEHDGVMGSFAHIAPGAALGGDVEVGQETLLGLNSTVLPRIHVGSRCVVGAGAVVIRRVCDDQTVVGVPARPLA